MRHILSLLLVILLSFSCQKEKKLMNRHLSSIESMMAQYPDSVLIDLNQIDPHKLTRSQQALYYLLLTAAQDKTYATPTSDSLITLAVNYFDRQDDPYHKAQAWYYKGRVNQELGNSLYAQKYYLKALDHQAQIEAPYLLGLIHNHLGMLYAYQSVYELALEHMQKSVDYVLQMGDSSKIGFAYRDLARCYDALQKRDSAIMVYQQALQYTQHYTIYNELGSNYTKTGEFTKGLQLAYTALNNISSEKRKYTIYLVLGKTHLQLGNQDSARFYLEKSVQSPVLATQVSSLYYLAEIPYRKGDFKSYANLIKKFESLNDTLSSQEHSAEIRQSHELYNHHLLENKIQAAELAASKTELFFLYCLIVALILFLFLMGTLWTLKKKQNKLLKQETEYAKQQVEFEKNKLLIATNEIKIATLNTELEKAVITCDAQREALLLKEREILKLSNQIVRKKIQRQQAYEDFKHSEIYQYWQQTYTKNKKWHPKSKELEELEIAFNSAFPSFTASLTKAYSTLSDQELKICMLAKLEFRPSFIARILNVEPNAISMSRKRLYHKITGKNGSAEDLDQYIKDL